MVGQVLSRTDEGNQGLVCTSLLMKLHMQMGTDSAAEMPDKSTPGNSRMWMSSRLQCTALVSAKYHLFTCSWMLCCRCRSTPGLHACMACGRTPSNILLKSHISGSATNTTNSPSRGWVLLLGFGGQALTGLTMSSEHTSRS